MTHPSSLAPPVRCDQQGIPREETLQVARQLESRKHLRPTADWSVSGVRYVASSCKRAQNGRGPTGRILFEGGSACEHEHDDGTGEVLAQQRIRDNRNARQQIRAKLSSNE